MKNCYGRWIRLPINSGFAQKLSLALLLTTNCLLFGLEGMFASRHERFTTLWNKLDAIIRIAQGWRCVIRKENANA